MKHGSIPLELVFNVDERAIHLVPASNWTMELEGSDRIPIIGLEDKREIMAVMGASCTGELLYTSTTLLYRTYYKVPPII